MKTNFRHIGFMFLILILAGISVQANAQDRKQERAEKKEARKAQLYANYNAIGAILNNKRFVLEAYYLSNKYGDKVPVSSNINFIMVNSDKGILQTGILSSIGYNGVGGVTAEGNIGKWEFQNNAKNQSFYLRYTLHTYMGTYDILLTVNAENHARAEITGLTPGKIIYEGELVPIEESRVFKGRSLI